MYWNIIEIFTFFINVIDVFISLLTRSGWLTVSGVSVNLSGVCVWLCSWLVWSVRLTRLKCAVDLSRVCILLHEFLESYILRSLLKYYCQKYNFFKLMLTCVSKSLTRNKIVAHSFILLLLLLVSIRESSDLCEFDCGPSDYEWPPDLHVPLCLRHSWWLFAPQGLILHHNSGFPYCSTRKQRGKLEKKNGRRVHCVASP